MQKPNLFIVGYGKCGTTSMWEYLDAHPDIFMSQHPWKEPHYFGADLISPVFLKDSDIYYSIFKDAGDARVIGEASTLYSYSKLAPVEIHNFNPQAKIIMMIRSPIDVLYSSYYRALANLNEDIQDFQAALDAEPERLRGERIPSMARLVHCLYYRSTNNFPDGIKRYWDVFGRSQIHIIVYDDLKNDLANVYRQTLEFLEVDSSFFPKSFEIANPRKTYRSRQLLKFLTSPPMVLRKLIRPIRPFVQPIYESVLKLNTTYKTAPMNPATRKRLQEEYKPMVAELSDMLGRDLTHWCE